MVAVMLVVMLFLVNGLRGDYIDNTEAGVIGDLEVRPVQILWQHIADRAFAREVDVCNEFVLVVDILACAVRVRPQLRADPCDEVLPFVLQPVHIRAHRLVDVI